MFKKYYWVTIAIVICVIVSNAAYAGLLKDQVLVSDGLKRTYNIYLPTSFSGKKSPLLLLLHGYMGDADMMTGENGKKAPYKVWLTIADREGWVLAIPNGELGADNFRGWNDCREDAITNPPTDDVKFLNKLVNTLSTNYPIDTTRVFVHGTSNGGSMAFRLAQESGKKYRAIAAIATAMPEKSKCKASTQAVSVLIMNGTDDPILPFKGGRVGKRELHKKDRGTVLSTVNTINYWVENNGITAQPLEKKLPEKDKLDGSYVYVKHYTGGNNKSEVMYYEIRGGGHTEPSLKVHYRSIYALVVGKQNKDIEMAEEVWRFFSTLQ